MAPRRQRATDGEARVRPTSRSKRVIGSRSSGSGRSSVRKLVELDVETWQAVDLLGRNAMKSFQELSDEAFRDLLKKHGRADTLRGALKRSAAAPKDTRQGDRSARARR